MFTKIKEFLFGKPAQTEVTQESVPYKVETPAAATPTVVEPAPVLVSDHVRVEEVAPVVAPKAAPAKPKAPAKPRTAKKPRSEAAK